MYAPFMRWTSMFILWLLAGLYLTWWVSGNPLPDGYQNEYLLIGNAFDLWGALTDLDGWHLRWYMYTGYWPWGLYAIPWPFLAILGPSRLALVLGNMIHLAVLLASVRLLGRAMGGKMAPLLVLLCPGVFGTLVRFEPSLAAIAWTAAGLAALVHSQAFERKQASWAFGIAMGLGLMMDRLSVAFFLLPAVIPLLPGISKQGLKHLGQGLLLTLLLTGAYYREFFNRHSHEIFSQATTGEIDSAGVLTETPALFEWIYYPLTLIDSQAGPILGVVMLIGLIGRLDRTRSILLASVLGGVAFFTLVSKNQVFYTLPILAPLAAMAATRQRIAWIGVVGGLWSFLSVGVGVLPGGPWLPEQLVRPRHTLARPPVGIDVEIESALSALGTDSDTPPDHILVLSQDHRLFEGFLLLAVRERWPDTPARGAVTDPHGTFEMFHEMDAFLWVGPRGEKWPSAASIREEMVGDHMDPDTMPPAPRVIEAGAESFREVRRYPSGPNRDVVIFRRK